MQIKSSISNDYLIIVVMTSRWFLLIILSILLTHCDSASQCFEPESEIGLENVSNHIYVSKEIYAVKEDATGIEKIKVWVDTPRCKEWTYRGCTIVCTQIATYCSIPGIFGQLFRPRCQEVYRSEMHYVYDRYSYIKNDAPANHKIVSCYIFFRQLIVIRMTLYV